MINLRIYSLSLSMFFSGVYFEIPASIEDKFILFITQTSGGKIKTKVFVVVV